MSESQAVYLSEISPELLKAIREALQDINKNGGYGHIAIEIRGGKLKFVNHEIKKVFD